MSLCSPREAYIYCSTMNSHNTKHYSATGDTSRRDSVLRATTCTAEEPAQSRTDQLLIGERHSNANTCSNNCLFRLEVLIKKSCYIKLRLQLDAVSSQFLFKAYINWNSKKKYRNPVARSRQQWSLCPTSCGDDWSWLCPDQGTQGGYENAKPDLLCSSGVSCTWRYIFQAPVVLLAINMFRHR